MDMRKSPVIRSATDSDIPAIQVIYAHHVLHGLASFEEAAPSLEAMRARFRSVIGLGLPYVAAEIDGHVAGYCYAAPYRARPAYRYTVEDSVYVAKGFARRGIGLALLQALIGRCEAGPWRRMLAVIGDSGNAASIALHAGCGFALIGTLPSVGFKFGRWVDSVLMQRALGAGDTSAPSQEGLLR